MLVGMAAARLLKPPLPPALVRWCGNVTVVPRSWESFCAARSSMRSSATAKSNASRTRFATWKATSLDETAMPTSLLLVFSGFSPYRPIVARELNRFTNPYATFAIDRQ